jgi:hypothetical protein
MPITTFLTLSILIPFKKAEHPKHYIGGIEFYNQDITINNHHQTERQKKGLSIDKPF